MFLIRNFLVLSSLLIFNTFNSPENVPDEAPESSRDNINWSIEGVHVNSFVENKGQFDYRPISTSSEILYVVDHGMEQIYFTKKGISYYFEKKERNPDRPKGDRTMPKKIRIKEAVHFEWENANPDVEVIAEDKRDDYFVYSFSGKGKSNFDFTEIKAQGFKKLTYKEIYPKIDLEYVFHPEGGVKYNVILHPGADLAQFKMNYTSDHKPQISNGKIKIPTSFGTITEHEPKTFYADSKSEIPSEFTIKESSVAFQLSNYDKSKKLVIDPWVQTPSNPHSNGVWEVETDASGNVYIIGGDSPMRLLKYNSTGTLQWTHNTPYSIDPDSMWLGSFATDQLGNSYVSNGSTAAIQKVNTNGSVDWNNPNPGFGSDEFWNITFNCDQSKLVVGGTVLLAGLAGGIFDIDVNNGDVLNSQIVTRGSFGINLNPQEVRSISSSFNAQYYFLSHDTIGAINQNISNSPCGNDSEPVFKFKRPHGYEFAYKCENYRPSNGNSGIMAIRANENFVYTQNGETLHKRSLFDGSILNTVSIPGGNSTIQPIINRNQAGNSGIAIDDCGNVYVGSVNAVIKYDPDLNLITTESIPYRAFDISVSSSGEILIAGTTGDNSTPGRTGYVQSINMNSCSPRTFTCCDATICPATFCIDESPQNLTAATSGGTWSGPGIMNSTNGEFDPVSAGPGLHTVTYTLPCGMDSIIIEVDDDCLEICIESNGDITVSNGTPPYIWQSYSVNENCDLCIPEIPPIPPIFPGVPPCSEPQGCVIYEDVWTTFDTSSTVSLVDSLPVRVIDSLGKIRVINDTSIFYPCTTDSCTNLTLSLSNINNPSCFGDADGSFTLSISGFTAPYEYTLLDQSAGVVSNFTSSNTTESFSGLSAQVYQITITDDESCTADTTIALTEPTELSISITDTVHASCSGNDGSATAAASGGTNPYTYSWSPSGGNNATANNLGAGSYTVEAEDANGCIASTSVLIESSDGPELTIDTVIDASCFDAEDGSVSVNISDGTPPYSFDWSNGDNTQNISGLAAGEYTLTASDDNNCTAIINATVNAPDTLSITGTLSGSGCDGDAAIAINVTGGTPSYSYEWSNDSTANTISNLNSGDYTVTVTDANNCTASESFNIDSTGSFNIELTAVNASCPGVNDGQITSSVSGANLPLSYSWSNGQQSADLNNVDVGTYSVTISDANNCTVTASETVFADENIEVFAGISQPICPEDQTGAIKITPLTGTPPYTGEWSNGENQVSISNLEAGTYSLTLTDSAGCVLDTSFDVNSLSNFEIQTTSSGLSCSDTEGNASAATEVTSGNTAPYTYAWNTGDSTQNISGLESGTYIVTVSDSLDCNKVDTVNIFAAGLFLNAEIINESCPDEGDGAIITTVAGGFPPYTYNWSTGSADSSIFNLSAGEYELTVTDAEDCSASETFEVEVSDDATENCDSLIIYDVFSPNGDGRNDIWIIDGLFEYTDNELQIFNRWGGKVFEANPYDNDWDGRSMKGEALPTATYYYILKVKNGSEKVYSGHVNIIR